MAKEQILKTEKIRREYEQKQKSKFEELKQLNKKVKRPADVFAYTYGSVSSLVLGTGMCFAMKVIGQSMLLGIGVGLLGIALAATTYPLYKLILNARRSKYSYQIFELTDQLLNK